MSLPAFFTDEDVYAAIAPALRNAGFDAISTPESFRRGETDESQLTWAAGQGRVLITFNVAHFAQLHSAWIRANQHHAGIVVSNQRSIGDMLRRLISLARNLDADSMRDRLEYLNDWS